MLKYISSVCAAAMVLSLPLMTPGFAMPRTMPAQAVQADMMLVQHDRGNRNWRNDRRGGDRNWNRGPQQNRHWNRPPPNRHASRDWERRGNNYYYRGHRGYRDHRPGYRQHNGWWFPPAAFIAGAIIGGAMIAEPPIQYRPRGNAHISWCYSRYKSYRASDNSFQPYNGPRRQCVSPYG